MTSPKLLDATFDSSNGSFDNMLHLFDACLICSMMYVKRNIRGPTPTSVFVRVSLSKALEPYLLAVRDKYVGEATLNRNDTEA